MGRSSPLANPRVLNPKQLPTDLLEPTHSPFQPLRAYNTGPTRVLHINPVHFLEITLRIFSNHSSLNGNPFDLIYPISSNGGERELTSLYSATEYGL